MEILIACHLVFIVPSWIVCLRQSSPMIHPINMPADFMHTPPGRFNSSIRNSESELFNSNSRSSSVISYTTDGRRLRDGEIVDKIDGDCLDNRDEPIHLNAVQFPSLSVEKQDGPLELKIIDLNALNNSIDHHTDKFNTGTSRNRLSLVVRRGQPFQIDMHFYRDIRMDVDSLRLIFQIGEWPMESKGTKMVLPLRVNQEVAGCRVDGLEITGCKLRISLALSPRTIVGVWNANLVTSCKSGEGETFDSEYPIGDVSVLFNPWCQDDDVFLNVADYRDEYVLNDVGKMWRGVYDSPKSDVWSYGQFEQGVLSACMTILDRSRLPKAQRGSPVQVSRTVVQMMNVRNGSGVLVGKWDDDVRFLDGFAPSQWTGSSEILLEFARFSHPVRYAQCWVFAGVVTTVLRALGIPCRPVTNYSSAHDTDTSRTIDIHFMSSTGKLIKELNHDSIWNFHVWNDCWMARPDLPEGYGGWQAVDATPQEKSDVGPASLRAIREGKCSFSYDTAFVFAEVQADKCYWVVDNKCARLNEIRQDQIGRMVVTKRPGEQLKLNEQDRMDITSSYKHPEMSSEERQSVLMALLTGHERVLEAYTAFQPLEKDVRFDLEFARSEVLLGEDFQIKFRVGNDNDSLSRSVRIALRINSVAYTGEQGRKIASDLRTVHLKPMERVSINLPCSYWDYEHRLKGDQATLLVTTMAVVRETGQIFTNTDDLQLRTPDVKIEVLNQPVLCEPFRVELKVANPLPRTLTNCSFMVEGPGLISTVHLDCPPVSMRSLVRLPLTVTPWRDGNRSLVAKFRSDQMADVQGTITVTVRASASY